MVSSIGRAEDPVRRRRLLAALVLIGMALLASAALGAASGARHALLISISDYSGSGFDDLPGAARDIELVSAVLTSRLGFVPGEIRILRNRAATHRGIERAFAELAASVAPGDTVFIHYSGHGSLVRDLNDDEPTGEDQTLVPFGARWEASEGIDRFDILDDELNGWLGRISDRLGPSGQLVMVSDACHAATNTRGPAPLVSRALPAAVQESHPRARGPRRSACADQFGGDRRGGRPRAGVRGTDRTTARRWGCSPGIGSPPWRAPRRTRPGAVRSSARHSVSRR